MLRRTFLFLKGVDEDLERWFWEQKIISWDDFLDRLRDLPFHPRRKARWSRQIRQAEQALARRDARYFERLLHRDQYWRMIADFQEETAYLDVEAYQTRPGRYQLTLAGLFFRGRYKAFVRGRNLHELDAYLRDVRLLITFGGQGFDLKMLDQTFGDNGREYAGYDLQPLFKTLGLPQGLKKLERLFGWRRGSGLDGLSGWVAVHLWERHREGDDRAIRALIRYNYEDVIRLPQLTVFAYNRMIEQFSYPFERLPEPVIRTRPPRFDRSILQDIRRRRWRRVRT